MLLCVCRKLSGCRRWYHTYLRSGHWSSDSSNLSRSYNSSRLGIENSVCIVKYHTRSSIVEDVTTQICNIVSAICRGLVEYQVGNKSCVWAGSSHSRYLTAHDLFPTWYSIQVMWLYKSCVVTYHECELPAQPLPYNKSAILSCCTREYKRNAYTYKHTDK